MKRLLAFSASSLLALGLATSAAQANDPTIGFGFTFTFGANGGGGGVGVKIFADDEREELTPTLGLDYMFDGSWRPNVGVAYILDGDGYIGTDIGYNYNRGAVDFGIGAGFVDSASSAAGGGGGSADGDTDGGFGSETTVIDSPGDVLTD